MGRVEGGDFVAELRWRKLIHDQSDPDLGERMLDALKSGKRFTVYIGFDPTADSLHIGSLLPILALKRAQQAGHRPIALVGGATGMIGDPSGKSDERNLLSAETLEKNVAGIRRQLERFLDFGSGGALLLNNYDWLSRFGYLEFLRVVGKHFSVNMMLGKQSVQARLEKESGISFTEFSYMLLQAYDFYHLCKEQDCRLQLGGSDQWGNITAGIDLIHRLGQGSAYGLTMPLVTTTSGQKFGKTEKGALWLDEARTSSFELYQFFVNTDDQDTVRLLGYYTFLDEAEITEIGKLLHTAPELREAQHRLAFEVTKLVHGEEAATRAAADARKRSETRSLEIPGLNNALTGGTLQPTLTDSRLELLKEKGIPLVDLLVSTNLSSSKSAARRDIEGGGISLNNTRVDEPTMVLNDKHLLAENCIHLRKGKKHIHIVQFTDDPES